MPVPKKKPRKFYLSPRERARRAETERTRKAAQAASSKVISAAVELVAASRGIPWEGRFQKGRGNRKTAAARVFLFGLLCEMEVPPFHVAKSFRRNWASVFCGLRRCAELVESSPEFADEFRQTLKTLRPLTDQKPAP